MGTQANTSHTQALSLVNSDTFFISERTHAPSHNTMAAEVPDCYICMEPESELMPFLKRPMCSCSSKADSSLKVHQLCLELSRDRTGKCAVCKTALSGDWAFDASFRRANDYSSTRIFTQMKGQAKHGAEYTLRQTNAYVGPIRYLAVKGQYLDDKLHGPQFTYAADGTAATESNYAEGVLHGPFVERNAKGVVTLQENYADGKLHGPRMELKNGFQLTGNYASGIKVGEHVEVSRYKYDDPIIINKANYKAGVLDGPFLQYHIKTGEGLPLETAVYRDGKLHGLQEKWQVNTTTLEREQTEENHWMDGLRNGRQAGFQGGSLTEETWYHMGQKHGLERLFFPDGTLQQELSWHLGEKHGRIRKWIQEYGKRTLEMDAAYDNGFRHGRFVTPSQYNDQLITEEFWSDGTKELRHGVHRIEEVRGEEKVVRQETHYKMGVRHGSCMKRDINDDGYMLNYSNGKLHGKCEIIQDGYIQATGNFREGVPVGSHMLYSNKIVWESVNYDFEGRLHGRCVFFLNYDGMPLQVLNYAHGVLHGRQAIFYAGSQREKIVFNMRKGYVHGRFTLYDERGAIENQRMIKQDEGVTLQECLGSEALCAPSERLADGTYEKRWTAADGSIHKCKSAITGDKCDCEHCYKPPKEKVECYCVFCREEREMESEFYDGPDYDSDHDRYYDSEEERYQSARDRFRCRDW